MPTETITISEKATATSNDYLKTGDALLKPERGQEGEEDDIEFHAFWRPGGERPRRTS